MPVFKDKFLKDRSRLSLSASTTSLALPRRAANDDDADHIWATPTSYVRKRTQELGHDIILRLKIKQLP